MPNKSNDDLSEMLNQLAESQKRQEAELHELAGANHNPPPLSVNDEDPIDAILADETTKLDRPDQQPAATPHEAANVEAPVAVVNEAASADTAPAGAAPGHRPVDDLIAIQQEGAADSADMLAELAQETGGESTGEAEPEAPAFEIEPEREAPQVLGGPTTNLRGPAEPRPAARRAKPAPRPVASSGNTLKAIFAPVLLTFGILMLVPAVWAVLILMGVETVMSKAQGVDTMAKIMLICWPVGLGLLAGAFVSFVQLSREKAKHKERMEAMQRRE